jgi:signal transduction histidine kinase
MPTAQEPSSELINAAELADLVAHEVNNLLNSVVLHTALLERSLPPETQTAVQPELEVIRQAVNRAGTMLRRWQQTGLKAPVLWQALDLNEVVRDLPLPREVPNLSGDAVAVQFHPTAGLPRALGNVEDLKRLVGLLLTCAAEVSPRDGSITVRTESAPGQVLLSVEDQGPPVDPALLDRVFEPFAAVRGSSLFPGSADDELRMATCKVLARRQKGTITAARRPEGGLTITACFTAAAG